MAKIIIIGNGISGITVARHIRKNSDHEITVISGESDFFFSRTALMYVYMGHMRFQDIKPYEDWFWTKNRIDLVRDWVLAIDSEKKEIKLKEKGVVSYDKLVLALGSKPNKFGWPGQDLNGVQGLYSFQDLENIEEYSKTTKEAVIVGGGLIGIELAEMFVSRGIKVTFLVRENNFWGNVLPEQEAKLVTKHILKHHVDLRLETELAEIVDDGSGRVGSVVTKSGEIINCQIVGLTAGVSPNIDFIKNTNIETKSGIVINRFFETSVNDIYAIGDCAEFIEPVEGRKKLEQVWYTGRIMGETLAQTLCGNRMEYKPGPWFNSAKFFDIEYQTYGNVNPTLLENEEDFYWEHKDGEKCVHLVWDKTNSEFKGINVFGIRMRHDLFDAWLNKRTTIDEVMSNLRLANFDPEFYSRYEQDIIAAFNQKTGKQVVLQSKKWWRNLLTAKA